VNSDGRSAVVVNPSKVIDLEERRREICAALAEAGWPEPLWLETTPEDPGCGQTRQAVAEGSRVVFAFGGDGTVMACVSELVDTDVALAVLPAGTGNLLAANLGLPDDVAAGVALAVGTGRRRIDVGEVGERRFAVMAGMGFDARMLDATPEKLKARIGWPAYAVAALRHLKERPMRVRIRLDDGPWLARRARTVLVANVGRLQGGIPLLSEASPDDGQLDVAVITPQTIGHWAAMAWAVARRRAVPRMETLRAARVHVLSDREQPRELDGDVIEPGRSLEVVVRERALLLCVPEPDEAPDLAAGAPD
jgi:diacylglycerol kinase family enzyme